MERLDPEFRPLVEDRLESLRADSGTVYGVWADMRLAYMNPAWFTFAAENEGAEISDLWRLGRPLLQAIAGELQEFYAARYRDCLRENRPWDHEYECSSDLIHRRHHQIAYPLRGGEGLLIVNSQVVCRPNNALPPESADREEKYRDAAGLIHQCSNCRRVARQVGEKRWDRVPDWVRRPPYKTSHSLCPPCTTYYHGL